MWEHGVLHRCGGYGEQQCDACCWGKVLDRRGAVQWLFKKAGREVVEMGGGAKTWLG